MLKDVKPIVAEDESRSADQNLLPRNAADAQPVAETVEMNNGGAFKTFHSQANLQLILH